MERVIEVLDDEDVTLKTYEYDGLNRRVSEDDGAAGKWGLAPSGLREQEGRTNPVARCLSPFSRVTDLYYSAAWCRKKGDRHLASVRANLRRRGAGRVGGLQGVATPRAATARSAVADVDVELADDRLAGNVGLELLVDRGFHQRAVAMRTVVG
jgi:hypothetical protein